MRGNVGHWDMRHVALGHAALEGNPVSGTFPRIRTRALCGLALSSLAMQVTCYSSVAFTLIFFALLLSGSLKLCDARVLLF